MSALTIVFLTAWVSAAPTDPPISIDGVFLTLIADVSVPALESGVLVEVVVKTGERVERGAVMGPRRDLSSSLYQSLGTGRRRDR